MAPPPIQLFLTTIVSSTQLRSRQEYILRILQVKKVPFTSYDLASDADAKNLWRRKAPKDKQQLPGILIGGEFPGDFSAFEEAVEFGEIDQFLRLAEDYNPFEDEKDLLPSPPIGVPGAYSPAQMHPHHQPSPSPQPSPLKNKPVNKKGVKGIDAGEELGDARLAGVTITDDDLLSWSRSLGSGEMMPTTSIQDEGKEKEGEQADKGTEQKVEEKVDAEPAKVGEKVDDVKQEQGTEAAAPTDALVLDKSA
ncbi:uncharacterized protein B0H18DRAFT_1205979 [Fomitopsis serialis]|uniref:uncharacterized protein n=1 Tax=Fomitopsis serialis TaxID=139415 RepID=UPI002008E59A|nr:uncharacterized protein B0H18DRAFT_1205979 [Neoantrodia serialis]KAH9937059.1 hypothetical protein B0H18DRAFT_1205979 [Neoantrodia serialis]